MLAICNGDDRVHNVVLATLNIRVILVGRNKDDPIDVAVGEQPSACNLSRALMKVPAIMVSLYCGALAYVPGFLRGKPQSGERN